MIYSDSTNYIVMLMHSMHNIRVTRPFTVTDILIGETCLNQPTRS